LVLQPSEADAGHGAEEGDLRRVQRERRGEERGDIRVVLLVRGDDVEEDLDLVLEALRKERPDGAVDDARGEDLLVTRTAFALDESAGYLPRGVRALLVLDREREEWEGADRVAHGHGC